MEFNLYIICILLVFHFDRCSGVCDIWEVAKSITNQTITHDLELWEMYNVPPTDYYFNFGEQTTILSSMNIQANALVEFQRLIRNTGQCDGENFHECVKKYLYEVPLDVRCQKSDIQCNPNDKYSQLSGLCNNLITPNLGAANTCFTHWIPPVYADGINQLRRSVKGEELPSPRIMGNIMVNAAKFPVCYKYGRQINNLGHVMWGQGVAHDITARKVATVDSGGSNPMRCCNQMNTRPLRPEQTNKNCIPIEFPPNDPFYSKPGIRCQPYIRLQANTQINCDIGFAIENMETHYLDLSTIYGTSVQQLNGIRANVSGLFQIGSNKPFPHNSQGNYSVPDTRFDQTTLLAVIYSLWMKFHNVLATELQSVNPHWTDEKTFYEARRLNIAIYQHILYCEWLPLLVDEDVLRYRNLVCHDASFYSSKYDANVDPSAMIEFVNGAFKFSHTNVPDEIQLADELYNVIKEFPFSNAYDVIDVLEKDFDEYLRGMLTKEQRHNEVIYTDQIRNLFIPSDYRGYKVGIDGYSLDMFRCRDSGMAPLPAFYLQCMNKTIECFEDLKEFYDSSHLELLESIYEDVEDIDLLAALFLEKRCNNFIGKIGGCIMVEQFYRFKYGDRFFYTHQDFTPEQLDEITKMTFAKIICMTTSIEDVPAKAFLTISYENCIKSCSQLGKFNFQSFRQ